MPGYIGSFACISLTGDLVTPGPKVEPIQRHGINGTDWRYLGSKGQSFTINTTAFITNSGDAGYQINYYQQSVGSELAMVDAIGNTWYIYVENVKSRQPKRVLNSNLGPGYLIESEWQIRMTGG